MWNAVGDFLGSQLGLSIVLMLGLLGGVMTAVAYLILFERKVAAWTQDRYGPIRVGPWGLLQPLADGLKLLLKEDIIPDRVEKGIFVIAPALALIIGMLGLAIMPFGGVVRFPWMDPAAAPLRAQVASVDIGLLFVLAVGSMGVYSVVLGGWASNNKYAFYGALRAAAQMLSYEVPLGLCLLTAILVTGQLRLEGMVETQIATTWTGLLHPLAFVIFFTTALAEANRAPFDLAECEQELVGGFHTEYSAMKWALYFLGEYAHMITSSALMVAVFLGGWELFPFSERLGISWIHNLNTSPVWYWMLIRSGVYVGKIAFLIFMYMLVRWTLPRFRFDQLMRLAWKGFVPIMMTLVAFAGVLLYSGKPASVWAPIGNVLLLLVCGLVSMATQKKISGRQKQLPPVKVGAHPYSAAV